jgi:hypothetical protein
MQYNSILINMRPMTEHLIMMICFIAEHSLSYNDKPAPMQNFQPSGKSGFSSSQATSLSIVRLIHQDKLYII